MPVFTTLGSLIAIVAFNSGSNTVTGMVNGSQIFSHSPPGAAAVILATSSSSSSSFGSSFGSSFNARWDHCQRGGFICESKRRNQQHEVVCASSEGWCVQQGSNLPGQKSGAP